MPGLTEANQVIDHQGVKIYGPINLPSMLAHDASSMYAKNVVNFLKLLIKDGESLSIGLILFSPKAC